MAPLRCVAPFLICLLVTPLAGQDPEGRQAFAKAQAANTVAAWQAFLRGHGKGALADKAIEAVDALLLQQAKATPDDATGLGRIYRQCRTPKVADEVFALWGEASWQAARKQDTEGAYRAFMLRFSGSKHTAAARAAIEERALANCKAAGDEDSWRRFLKEYPRSKHAKEARRLLRQAEIDRVRKIDTIEAWQGFLKKNYKHPAARNRLGELLYAKAADSDQVADWRAFYNAYNFKWRRTKNKEHKRLLELGQNAYERSLYAAILRQPDLKTCTEYERVFRNGPHRQQVRVKKEDCLFLAAEKSNTVRSYLNYLRSYPVGFRDAEVRQRLDKLVFEGTKSKAMLAGYEQYLRACPKDRARLQARMEPLLRAWALQEKTSSAYAEYLRRFGSHAEATEIRRAYDPMLFAVAQKEDWHSAYRKYLRLMPQGVHVADAKRRLAELRQHKAVVVIKSASSVIAKGSRWSWVTRFKETSGKSGFKLTGYGWVYSKQGSRYGPRGSRVARGTVQAAAGGAAQDSYWLRGSSFRGGYVKFTWTGEDAGGHRLTVVERVELK